MYWLLYRLTVWSKPPTHAIQMMQRNLQTYRSFRTERNCGCRIVVTMGAIRWGTRGTTPPTFSDTWDIICHVPLHLLFRFCNILVSHQPVSLHFTTKLRPLLWPTAGAIECKAANADNVSPRHQTSFQPPVPRRCVKCTWRNYLPAPKTKTHFKHRCSTPRGNRVLLWVKRELGRNMISAIHSFFDKEILCFAFALVLCRQVGCATYKFFQHPNSSNMCECARCGKHSTRSL